MFDTQFNRDNHSIHSEPGSPIKKLYKMTVDDDGRRELKPCGEYDLQAEIDSHLASCSLEVILAKYFAGDVTALSRVQGVYGDFSNMPTTLAELSQRVIDAENIFNSMPLDVREQFNFSASEFFAQLNTDKAQNAIKSVFSPSVDVSRADTLAHVDSVADVVESEVINA